MAHIEDYAFVGDTHQGALVSLDGSMDWLCLPRFDSSAVFAAILDPERGGCWKLRPTGDVERVSRSYRHESMVLETTFETATGSIVVVDCLPLERRSRPKQPRQVRPEEVVVRAVTGLSGTVEVMTDFAPRFDYGDIVPWFRSAHGIVEAVGGPDALDLSASVELDVHHDRVTATFELSEGETASFVASYHPSHLPVDPRRPEDCAELVEVTDRFWTEWADICTYEGRWRSEVIRSLITLKGLIFSPSGGVVAAATTSLPESLGGERNWDYRYCWLRDATFTLDVLVNHGYTEEAEEWRDWLLRAVAGEPQDLQIMYGVLGERRLTEEELPWLAGYEGSRPVRIGNAAHEQFQLDVYGEVMDSFHSARRAGIETSEAGWNLEREIVDHVCERWIEPDEGIWEVRAERKHFVHSKVMAWVAIDRGIKAIEDFGKTGPVRRWKETRDAIRNDVMEKGVDRARGCFKRAYDEDEVDAALLTLPLVGFVEPTDPLMKGTVDAIREDLMADGLVRRYRTDRVDDGMPPGEGAFLMCTFWFVDCLALVGELEEARALFERLVGLCNDVGLLAEQYDVDRDRFLGNFPQAFSHVALVTSATALESADRRKIQRGR